MCTHMKGYSINISLEFFLWSMSLRFATWSWTPSSFAFIQFGTSWFPQTKQAWIQSDNWIFFLQPCRLRVHCLQIRSLANYLLHFFTAIKSWKRAREHSSLPLRVKVEPVSAVQTAASVLAALAAVCSCWWYCCPLISFFSPPKDNEVVLI